MWHPIWYPTLQIPSITYIAHQWFRCFFGTSKPSQWGSKSMRLYRKLHKWHEWCSLQIQGFLKNFRESLHWTREKGIPSKNNDNNNHFAVVNIRITIPLLIIHSIVTITKSSHLFHQSQSPKKSELFMIMIVPKV